MACESQGYDNIRYIGDNSSLFSDFVDEINFK